MEPKFITVRAAADLAQVDPKTIRRWYREGLIRKYKAATGAVSVDEHEIRARITPAPEPVRCGA